MDTEVDRRLEEIGTDEALALRGETAVANARLAYRAFLDTFTGERWRKLVASGARIQRPLWASTSTKNPEYRDTLYVDELVAPHTVNTMPLETIDAYQDHGPEPVAFGPEEIAQAQGDHRADGAVGVDYDDVMECSEREGSRSSSTPGTSSSPAWKRKSRRRRRRDRGRAGSRRARPQPACLRPKRSSPPSRGDLKVTISSNNVAARAERPPDAVQDGRCRSTRGGDMG